MAVFASARVTLGGSSLSAMVRVRLVGFATPLAPETVAETVTVSAASSVVSSTAVTVTVPVLVVASPRW